MISKILTKFKLNLKDLENVIFLFYRLHHYDDVNVFMYTK